MKVINSHKRIINQPKEMVAQLFDTLATKEDLIWPHENWPALKFKDGLTIGSKGGHGRIRYTIIEFDSSERIKFRFLQPEGFIGTHELKIKGIAKNITTISHEINVNTTFKATLFWMLVIRWLHDALIEDAFDKVENYFTPKKSNSKHNMWVKFLRNAYKRKAL